MTQELLDLKQTIIEKLQTVRDDRSFAALLTALLSDIADMDESRGDFMPILTRMFERLNQDETQPYDTRQSSPAYNLLAPIAAALADQGVLVKIMTNQVFVHTANGISLDELGADHGVSRRRATQALRTGASYNVRGELFDFPIGSRLMTRGDLTPIVFEIIESTGGVVRFRCEEYGTVGNTYYGELSPTSSVSMNEFGRALITDTFVPGQNDESDEDYRSRLLRHLRRVGFGGNVAQYQEFMQAITGVTDSMIFPAWHGGGSSHVSIVVSNNEPAAAGFVEHVNNEVDPVERSGSGFGIAPLGHRVRVTTPEWMDIDIGVDVVLSFGVSLSQVQDRLEELLRGYFSELRSSVLDVWEQTYFANIGMQNEFVNVRDQLAALSIEHSDPRLLELADYFPAEKAIQTHTWRTIVHPQTIGVRLLETGLVSAVDFNSMQMNGQIDPNGFRIDHDQDMQFLPRLGQIHVEAVDYITPIVPPTDPIQTVQKVYITGYDKPVSEISEIAE